MTTKYGTGAACPHCGNTSARVVDSRPTEDGTIRRRRKCPACQGRWTTYEVRTDNVHSASLANAAAHLVEVVEAQREALDRALAVAKAAIMVQRDAR